MNSEEGTVHQKRATKDPILFVQENALVKEVDGNPVITSKGAQFLQEHEAAAGQSSQDLAGVVQ